ncbi:polysaccharide deacetylase family protein [Erwinia mallotivora]|uniref:polysaccharide deacetylase family protein n=1 Tax=Erwinia mallotivora TaxID=69222 RepID=UPI0035EB731D
MKRIHLSFDDGPHPVNTLQILETLKEYNIKATFFVLGERVKNYGSIVEEIIAEGHRVGNHTYDHKDLTTLSEQEITDEIRTTEKLIAQHAPVDHIIRPPYGSRNTKVNNGACNLNCVSACF